MNERRSLAAGMTALSGVDADTARAFITQEPKPSRPVPVTPVTPPERIGVEKPQPAATEQPRRATKKSPPHRLTPVGLIPVTVRLRPEVAGALKRASLERQLAGEETYTQQELVEQLLEPWLRDHGFLD